MLAVHGAGIFFSWLVLRAGKRALPLEGHGVGELRDV